VAALLAGALATAGQAANQATLAVVAEAAIEGERGLRVTVDGRLGPGQRAFLVDESPAAERSYRASFWFDPNGLVMAPGESLVLFEGVVPNVAAGPQRTAGFRLHLRKPLRLVAPRLVGEVVGADRVPRFTPAVAIPLRGPQRVQVEWRAASAPGVDDGLLRLSLSSGRARTVSVAGVANAGHRLLTVRLGAVSEAARGTFGSFFVDGFESSRIVDP
jgi:hypothetical protein